MNRKLLIKTVFLLAIIFVSSTPVTTQAATFGNKEFLDALNAAINKIVDSGDYDTIYNTWFAGEVVLTDDSDANTAKAFPTNPTKGGTLQNIIDNGTIYFGSDTTYPPFEFIKDGKVVGFDADIADAIAAEFTKAYGVTITAKMVTTDWDPIIPDLKSGKFDAILSAMTKTAERAQEIDFTRSYYTSKQGILQGDNSFTITKVEDLNSSDYTIAVQSGTTSDLYAQAHLSKAKIVGFASFDAAVDALAQGDADFLLGDLPVIAYYSADNPSSGFKVVGSFGDEELFGIGVRKDTETAKAPFPALTIIMTFLVVAPIIRRRKN